MNTSSNTQDSGATKSQATQHWQLNKSVIDCNRHMLDNRIATDVKFLVSSQTAGTQIFKMNTSSNTQDSGATKSQATQHWQLNKSVIDCNRHMLDNRIATDVKFLVSSQTVDYLMKDADSESQTFAAHKYMLMSRSPVFDTMLCGVLAETGQIRITDFHPEAFRQMLNYIYTDNLDLNPDLVMSILYASKKYMLPGLTKKCTDYLKAQLDASNVCTILDQSILFDEKELAEQCMKLIKRNTEEAFNSDSFTSVKQNVLSKILDGTNFSLKEVDVFKAFLKWADGKCREQNMETTGANRRRVLGDCVRKFRYADIEIGEFATVVISSEILTKLEGIGISHHLANKETNPIPPGFCSDSRFVPGPYEIFATEATDTLIENVNSFAITIVCDSDIRVKAFVIGTDGITYLSSVRHNGEDVYGYWKQESTFHRHLIIKAGESRIHMSFSNDECYDGDSMENVWAGYAYKVYVVDKTEIVLEDDNIKMKLTSNYQEWMPILGLKYELITND